MEILGITFVRCQDCQLRSSHALMDERGTVMIATCAFNIVSEVAVDPTALRECRNFRDVKDV